MASGVDPARLRSGGSRERACGHGRVVYGDAYAWSIALAAPDGTDAVWVDR
ncbi:hypothetical protein AB0M48_07725 [Lentzea sp. NPDC051208]|uniref:hypothetical protein n=1 Tax=Lentzea sp. NPDC051208 TaxID=3154642 RepID=UPI0034496FEB